MLSRILGEYSPKGLQKQGRGRGQYFALRIFKGIFDNPRKSPHLMNCKTAGIRGVGSQKKMGGHRNFRGMKKWVYTCLFLFIFHQKMDGHKPLCNVSLHTKVFEIFQAQIRGRPH